MVTEYLRGSVGGKNGPTGLLAVATRPEDGATPSASSRKACTCQVPPTYGAPRPSSSQSTLIFHASSVSMMLVGVPGSGVEDLHRHLALVMRRVRRLESGLC